jgi:hypothetical protein
MVETLSDIPEVEGSSYVKWVRGLEEKIGEGRFRGGYYEVSRVRGPFTDNDDDGHD